LVDPQDPLGAAARARLPASTGLSPQGVELALREHLETQPAAEAVAALLAGAGRAPRCHVVLAANVCVAPLRALACALATSPSVRLRPSRRDPVVAELLLRALADEPTLEADVQLVDSVHPRRGDELHVYGSDASIEAIVRTLPPGVLVRAHGTGLGVAVVGAHVSIDDAAEELGADLVPFDGAGCLSPRLAVVEGDGVRLARFAQALHDALLRRGAQVPRGPLGPSLRAELARYRTLMQTIGEVLEGAEHLIGLDPAPRALALPPAARAISLLAAGEPVLRLLAAISERVTAFGVAGDSSLARRLHQGAPLARLAPLGTMQKPPLDGPVDGRTVPWLTS